MNDSTAANDLPGDSPAVRLERGEFITCEPAPFPLPSGEELDFLLTRRTKPGKHKDVSLDPESGRLSGVTGDDERNLISEILRRFSHQAGEWLREQCPQYLGGIVPDRVALRTEEEATRVIRLTSRNDLLHIDNFPTRPSQGRRILRIFANIHPSEPRVWSMSESFTELLDRYEQEYRIPRKSREDWLDADPGWLDRWLGIEGRTHYDSLMMRLHHFLKKNDRFQGKARRTLTYFAPGSVWMLMTDGVAHAQLRGRFALEHSFFIEPQVLVHPDLSPLHLLAHRGLK